MLVLDKIKAGIIALLLFSLLPLIGHAEPPADASQVVLDSAVGAESWEQFQNLINVIERTRETLIERRAEHHNAVTDKERARISQEIEQISLDIQQLQLALEMMLTGGADISLFRTKTEEEKIDWRTQLESVFEPILVEMRRLTERPRQIERLRNELAFFQERLDVAEGALLSISTYRQNAPTAKLKKDFENIEEPWRRKRDDLKNRLALAKFEQKEAMSPSRSTQRNPTEALKELLGGHVLNLALALLVMGVVYAVLKLFAGIYHRAVMRRAQTRKVFLARFGNLLFYFFTGLVVLLSGMGVLYLRSDWVLLALLVIALAGAAWALQKSLPRFVTEMKIMLNLGPVREGERIVYQGLPWRVNALTFSATLQNPLLDGGFLQVPVRELVTFQSRRFTENEPWFPSRVGDFVLFDEATFGKVIAQTPETVQVQVRNAIQAFTTTAYLDKSPRNLSTEGFDLIMSFGLDYQHQADITTTIPQTLAAYLREGVAKSAVGEALKELRVEFEYANSSSLDLAIVATFSGAAAEKYTDTRRLLQRLAVEACNEFGWVIPFNQLSVRVASDMATSPVPSQMAVSRG